MPLDDEVLLRALDVKGGRRVAELRAAVSNCPPPDEVLARLRMLEGEGQIRCGDDGRWTLRKAARKQLLPLGVARQAVELGVDGLPLVYDPGPPDDLADGGFALDPSQRPVVEAPPSERQLVEAGPGYGKTAVLCARVAWLLEQGLDAPSILVLSFTRTAVRELRNRIRELARQGVDTGGIEIRTLDSWAWGIRKTGTDARASSYEQSIREVETMLVNPRGEVSEHIQGYEHVFVDEAQDLVGARARLVRSLLGALKETCGYTVFLDPAQAIYDWSDDDARGDRDSDSFVGLAESLARKPAKRQLAVLHRTHDPDLRRLLLGARQLVLPGATLDPLPQIRRVLDARAGGERLGGEPLPADVRARAADSLVLYRHRRQVLDASSWLSAAAPPVDHRLRFGGLPPVMAPWIAMLIHDAFVRTDQLIIPKAKLEECWNTLAGSRHTGEWTFAQAWRALRRIGNGHPSNAVDVRRLAGAVAVRRVPDEVLLKEIGPGGPILGTIHGSKGREADEVVLALPEPWEREQDPEEDEQEARVLYVGLSRAKQRLEVRQEASMWSKRLDSGRVWQRQLKGAFRIEIGREGDLDFVAGLAVGGIRQQQWLRNHDGAITELPGVLTSDRNWRWELRHPPSMVGGESFVVAVLSRGACDEIRFAAAGGNDRMGTTGGDLRYLRMMDITTVAIDPDLPHPDRAALPEPWRTIGVWLAPVVVGLGRTYARFAKR